MMTKQREIEPEKCRSQYKVPKNFRVGEVKIRIGRVSLSGNNEFFWPF